MTIGITDLDKKELTRLVGLYAGMTATHYGLWYARAAQELSLDTAVEAEWDVLEAHWKGLLKRLAPHVGIDLMDGVPSALVEASEERLIALLQDLAKCWLASDGIWFQALEKRLGMTDAKVVNDSCWSMFGPMEAFKLARFAVRESSDLKTLAKTLPLRLYSSFNANEIQWESDNSFVWKMIECRVQIARRRKGMDDYPCKSAGIAEYTSFAQGIGPQIKVECVTCPPETPIDEGLFCAWRFSEG